MGLTLLLYSRENGNCLQDPQLKRPRHTNLMKNTTIFQRKVLPGSFVLVSASYESYGDGKSTNPVSANQVSNVPCLS